MTLQEVRSALAWCTVINFGLLTWWFLFFSLAHDWTYRIHSKLYRISVEKFDAANYASISYFKFQGTCIRVQPCALPCLVNSWLSVNRNCTFHTLEGSIRGVFSLDKPFNGCPLRLLSLRGLLPTKRPQKFLRETMAPSNALQEAARPFVLTEDFISATLLPQKKVFPAPALTKPVIQTEVPR